jgi:ATP-dependent DNA helicase RecQ
VLRSWDWAERPTAVLRVGSHRRPQLVADLAARIARIGRLNDLGELPHLRESARARSNGAQRVATVYRAYRLPEQISQQLQGQPVLLVDDFIDTGWTMAELARQLTEAGAGAVLPFALGLAG